MGNQEPITSVQYEEGGRLQALRYRGRYLSARSDWKAVSKIDGELGCTEGSDRHVFLA